MLFAISIMSLAAFVANAAYWRAAGPYLLAACLNLAAASAIFLAMIYRMFPLGRERG